MRCSVPLPVLPPLREESGQCRAYAQMDLSENRTRAIVFISRSDSPKNIYLRGKHNSMTTPILPFQDTELSFEDRARDLVSRMTLEEKAHQMAHDAPALDHLGMEAHNWWNECLHGVARAGLATVFPQAIGMAASWNVDLIGQIATAISDEGRAKHHQAMRDGKHEIYYYLTYWTPNINIFRDPRWGRGQETYGECPYLTSQLGMAFVRGIQGDDPAYLKAVATPKHFAVHSGPEHTRHHADVDVSERDLRETYLPAFEATIREAHAQSVMGAYQRFRGEPCCGSTLLLQNILRDEWGFEGYVVSDCWAIRDFYENHQVVETAPEAAAMAVKAGCDLNCGEVYPALIEAVKQGLIDEATIDQSLERLMTARFKLGEFDPPENVPYTQIPYEIVDCSEHRALALQAARESMVLLKNDDRFLPLSRKDLKRIAVIGPHADSITGLLSNYNGWPAQPITPLQGIRDLVGNDIDVLYAAGTGITRDLHRDSYLDAAVEVARRADVAILCLGLSQDLEGEENEVEGNMEFERSQGDRSTLDLPEIQHTLLEAIYATRTPVVLVLMNGSAVAVNWAQSHVPAILEAWYPGQAGGTAIAETLFGDYNPGGRLPVTFYKSLEQLPPFEDYAMRPTHTDPGRTYRFFTGEPLYAFGHGLSYTQFKYDNVSITPTVIEPGDPARAQVTVTNIGDRSGDEVVQFYLRHMDAPIIAPRHKLVGFKRIHLEPGSSTTVAITIKPAQMAIFTDDNRSEVNAGQLEIFAGGRQPGEITTTSAATQVVSGQFSVRNE